jgi:hypothetical protein
MMNLHDNRRGSVPVSSNCPTLIPDPQKVLEKFLVEDFWISSKEEFSTASCFLGVFWGFFECVCVCVCVGFFNYLFIFLFF